MKRVQELRGEYFLARSNESTVTIVPRLFFLTELDKVIEELQEIKTWYSLGGK